jgi:hypothetical protein
MERGADYMTKIGELYALIFGVLVLSFIGVATIGYISYIRPTTDNTQIYVMVCGFLAPTIFTFANLLKSYQNAKEIGEIKTNTNGMTTQLVNSAAKVATLTEKVEGANKAAEVAKQTAVDTAVALAAKTVTTYVKEENK